MDLVPRGQGPGRRLNTLSEPETIMDVDRRPATQRDDWKLESVGIGRKLSGLDVARRGRWVAVAPMACPAG
jgi:hypothetical protein